MKVPWKVIPLYEACSESGALNEPSLTIKDLVSSSPDLNNKDVADAKLRVFEQLLIKLP